MQHTDSRKRKLGMSEALMQGIFNYLEMHSSRFNQLNKAQKQQAVLHEIGTVTVHVKDDHCKVEQEGNSIFLTIHDTEKQSVMLSAYNADIVHNFVANAANYFKKLHDKYAVKYIVIQGDEAVHILLKKVFKQPNAMAWAMRIMRHRMDKSRFQFFIYLGGN